MYRNGKALVLVVTGPDEKIRIMKGVHGDPVGRDHFGMTVIFEKNRKRFWWKSFFVNVKEFVRECDPCRKVNHSNLAPVPVLPPITVKKNFHRCGLALVGPLKETNSFQAK